MLPTALQIKRVRLEVTGPFPAIWATAIQSNSAVRATIRAFPVSWSTITWSRYKLPIWNSAWWRPIWNPVWWSCFVAKQTTCSRRWTLKLKKVWEGILKLLKHCYSFCFHVRLISCNGCYARYNTYTNLWTRQQKLCASKSLIWSKRKWFCFWNDQKRSVTGLNWARSGRSGGLDYRPQSCLQLLKVLIWFTN